MRINALFPNNHDSLRRSTMRNNCEPWRSGRYCLASSNAGATSIRIDRRRFISGIAAAGFSVFACPSVDFESIFAQAPKVAKRNLIDVHHHFFPPFYLSENRGLITTSRGGQIDPAWLSWSPEQAIDAMDNHGVATAVLSLPTPGVWFGDRQAAAQTARRANEYAAELARSRPGRFGLFAAIPLPDTEGSLREIEYALNVLKADGIGLMTSYDDKWLGDALYQPVFEELNRREAVVFVHPTTALCCRTLQPDVSPLVVEIPQDTTRAVTNLLFTGTFGRFKDIRFIFTHAGGSVPMVLGRMHRYAPKNIAEMAPSGIEYELKRLYYDIAGTVNRSAIAALTSLVPTRQIVFGSDNPFVPLAETAEGMMQVGFSASDLQRIGRDNALALLPRLKAIPTPKV
jgi:6-methylsalicylate decarboxylase